MTSAQLYTQGIHRGASSICQHIAFNAIATVISWLTALVVVIVFLAVEDWRHRPQAVLLENALKNGESQSVEFKEGHADVPL